MDDYTKRRLIYVKSLFSHGDEHSISGNQIDIALAILNFDSSIEMLFYAILEFCKCPHPKGSSLSDLIDSCKMPLAKEKVEISQLELANLRRARNNVQHYGIIPSDEDIIRFRSLVKETLQRAFLQIFTIKFEEVSYSLLFKDENIRKIYTTAEQAFFKNEYENSILYSITAFEIAKKDERSRLIGSGLGTVAFFLRLSTDGVGSRIIAFLNIVLQDLEVLKLGMDYKKFMKYSDICKIKPFSDIEGQDTESIIKNMKENLKISNLSIAELKTVASFCLEFSAENILKWQKFQREVDVIKKYFSTI